MGEDKKTLLVIDGNSLAHRAFHALPPLVTKGGVLTGAVYGFLLALFKAIKDFQPDFIAATFDLPSPTFRHQKFQGYKANRVKAPDEFYNQLPKIKEILRAFDIQIFEKEGYEADDLIGTIAKSTSRKQVFPKVETIILSGDLDNLQLIDPNIKVYTFKKGVKETILYDEEIVEKRYQGLKPNQLADFRALRGDPSDNIPGVPGVGEKTAINLLREFGNVDNLYKEIEEKTERAKGIKTKLKETLVDSKELAFLSRELATIQKEVSVDFCLEKCRWRDYDKEKSSRLLKGLEFYSLINRLP